MLSANLTMHLDQLIIHNKAEPKCFFVSLFPLLNIGYLALFFFSVKKAKIYISGREDLPMSPIVSFRDMIYPHGGFLHRPQKGTMVRPLVKQKEEHKRHENEKETLPSLSLIIHRFFRLSAVLCLLFCCPHLIPRCWTCRYSDVPAPAT